ncbi:hypothetical protein ACQKO6_15640 [Pseudomonas monteilii]|uniref:hypothetical protein n=1 Tax=Pseudomonas alabamensis TaxID=3064349 RepID=UPI0027132B41|nr:hypothetical protein [Pseudomonas sp. 22-AL-CL-001]MDO7910052.1 hypothetical protein [Pseudomonas sp. 22-AL-CL-001]
MSQRVELVIGVVEKVSEPVNKASATSAIVDQYNTDKTGFALVNQGLQTASVVASVMSITRITTGFVPFVNVQANLLAGTTTFLKIVADVKEGKRIESGDRLALMGNVAGIVAAVAILGGARVLAAGSTFVGIGINVVGLYESGVLKALQEKVLSPLIDQLIERSQQGVSTDGWVTAGLQIVSAGQVVNEYGNIIAVINWDPVTNVIDIASGQFSRFSDLANAGSVSGNGGGGGVIIPIPALIPEPPLPGPRIDISIESIGPGPGPGGQDTYLCCTGARQDKYL